MGDYHKLMAYKLSFSLAMKIFETTKKFPTEERYGLVNQIRRSSRSVCVNIVEAYRRRRYSNYFISRLNDAESENAETQVWLEFAYSCNYISKDSFFELTELNSQVGKLLNYMINNPQKFQ